jgi:hypothetical protein
MTPEPEPSLALLADHAEYSSPYLQDFRFASDYDNGSTSRIKNGWHHTSVDSRRNSLQTTPGVSTPETAKHRNISELSVLLLHIFLVMIHGALLVTMLTNFESKVVMPLSEGSGRVSTLIVVVSQIFAIVCNIQVSVSVSSS